MGYVINIEGDFRGTDPQVLEGYLQQLVEDELGEQVARVTFHGSVTQQSQREIQIQLNQQRQ